MKNVNTVYTLEYEDDYTCSFESLETACKMREIFCKRSNISIEAVSIVKIETITTCEKVG